MPASGSRTGGIVSLHPTMLIALAAALSPLAPQDPAALHPSDAALVLQIPDVPALRSAYAGTALARALADEGLHDAIGQVMGGPPLDPVAYFLGEYRVAVDEGDSPPVLEMMAGLSSISLSMTVVDGDLAAFVDAMDAYGNPDELARAMGLRVVVDFADEPAREQMDAIVEQIFERELPAAFELRSRAMGAPGGGLAFGSDRLTLRSIGKREPDAAGNAMADSLRIVSGGKRMAMTMGNVDFDAALLAFASGAAEPSAVDRFAEGRKLFGGVEGAPVAEIYLEPFLEQVILKEAPQALPALDLVEGIGGPMASMVIRGGHWRIAIDEGQFVTQGLHAPGDEGPMSGLIGAQALEADALQLAHPDALVTSVTSFDPTVLARLIETSLPAEGEGSLSFFEENFGFRPDRDIAGSLGNAISYSLPSLRSLVSAPNLMGVAALEDRDAFIQGMDGLFAMAEELGGDVQVQRSEYREQMVYTLSFTNMFGGAGGMSGLPFDPASFFRPTVTVMDDRVLLTTLPTHAKKEIRRVKKAKDNDEPLGVHAGIEAMGIPEGVTSVGFADWASFFGKLYTQLKSIAPMIEGMAGGELPFDASALPDATLLTKYFEPSQRWVSRGDVGVRHFSRSSLGPEIGTVPIVGAFGLAAGRTVVAMPEEEAVVLAPESVEVSDPRPVGELAISRTQESLVEISVAIRLYALDHSGSPPDGLADLLEKTDSYPGGYLEGGSVPSDAWGQPMVYEKSESGYAVRSVGPNGIDEAGGGDDLTLD